MTGHIQIIVEHDGIETVLKQAQQQLTNTQPLMAGISAIMLSAIEHNFAKEQSPEGTPWTPLSDITIRQRERSGHWPGKMLQVRGLLAAATTPSYSNDYAQVSNNRPQAAIQHFGGKTGRGHKVTIPARPYFGLSQDHINDIITEATDHITITKN